jgi:hypothetical protein
VVPVEGLTSAELGKLGEGREIRLWPTGWPVPRYRRGGERCTVLFALHLVPIDLM